MFKTIATIATKATLIGKYKVGKKAGLVGWELIVPFYNYFVMTKLSKKSHLLPTVIVSYIALAALIIFVCFVPFISAALGWSNASASGDLMFKVLGIFGNEFAELFLVGGIVSFFLFFQFMLAILVIPLVVMVYYVYKPFVARFNKGGFFAFGLLIFPYIFWPILDFDDSKYDGGEAAQQSQPQPQAQRASPPPMTVALPPEERAPEALAQTNSSIIETSAPRIL